MEHERTDNRDEQYPLLKVEGPDGGGDMKPRVQLPPTVVTTGWSVTRTPKQSWLDRWPEFMSACWMTLILLAISFLVFYALGMSAYRRQPVVVFKCNNSKPASDVYYHHIVSKGSYIPFAIFSEYLSTMATQYPSLRFNIYFLVDDSIPAQIGKRTRLFKRLVPAIPGTLNMIVEQSNKREIRDFQRRYQNVNITIIPLSKYMAKTPLRNKWRYIPPMYLTFYARIFSVWQTGGIGIDLITFNNIFNSRQDTNDKMSAILRQHNDGIEIEKYVDILNVMGRDEENEIFSLFFNVMNHLLNQTSLLFNAGDITPELKLMESTPLVRTHRSKRDSIEQSKLLNISTNGTNTDSTLTELTLMKLNTNKTLNVMGKEMNTNASSTGLPAKASGLPDKLMERSGNIVPMILRNSEVATDFPHVMVFYDFLLSDDIGPSYPLPFAPMTVDGGTPMKITEFKKLTKQGKHTSNHLTVSSDGTFIAAPMCYHPFLTQLMSTGCKRQNPKIAIKDTLMSQCSTFLRDDVYCENIHIIDSIF